MIFYWIRSQKFNECDEIFYENKKQGQKKGKTKKFENFNKK